MCTHHGVVVSPRTTSKRSVPLVPPSNGWGSDDSRAKKSLADAGVDAVSVVLNPSLLSVPLRNGRFLLLPERRS
jgi:hypothetical protein